MKVIGKEGVVVNYGCLSNKDAGGIDTKDLTIKKKVLRGFMIMHWIGSLADSERYKRYEYVRDHLEFFKTNIREIVPMKDFKSGYERYQKDMGKGKVIVVMSHLANVERDKK